MARNHNQAAEDHVRAARAKAVYLRPYFARALYALLPRCTEEVPTMAVDTHGRLYYNPTFVQACAVDEIATVCLHEIGHVLRRHHERADALGITEATHKIANIAQDCEINDDIAEEVKTLKDISALPGDCMYPSKFGFADNQTWEVYYHLLLDLANKQAAQGKQGDEGSGGSGGDSSKGEDGKGKGSKGDGKGKNGDKSRKHECGSGAHGVPRPWEDKAPSKGGSEGIEDADWKDIERQVAKDIREHSQKGRGTVPGHWVEWADDMLKVERIPWEQELSGAVRWAANDVAGKVTHNYRRPSRRQQAVPNVVFPSMRKPIPSVAFVGDTSGSMSSAALSLVQAVVVDVCAALGASLSFIATDYSAHGVQRTHNGRALEMRGRGGTDMRAGIVAALEEVRPRPDVIIIGSDCDTPWGEDPGVRVIICAIQASEEAIAGCPEWARVIEVFEEGGK
jgi:predicted metal-dependent peptidase